MSGITESMGFEPEPRVASKLHLAGIVTEPTHVRVAEGDVVEDLMRAVQRAQECTCYDRTCGYCRMMKGLVHGPE